MVLAKLWMRGYRHAAHTCHQRAGYRRPGVQPIR
ncbi:hypothetical protein [Mycolicibacterium lutetiense]